MHSVALSGKLDAGPECQGQRYYSAPQRLTTTPRSRVRLPTLCLSLSPLFFSSEPPLCPIITRVQMLTLRADFLTSRAREARLRDASAPWAARRCTALHCTAHAPALVCHQPASPFSHCFRFAPDNARFFFFFLLASLFPSPLFLRGCIGLEFNGRRALARDWSTAPLRCTHMCA